MSRRFVAKSNAQLNEAIVKLEQRVLHGDAPLPLYAELLRHCGAAKAIEEGKRLHTLISRSPHYGSILLSNLLVQMYGRCGCTVIASTVFDQIAQKNTMSWNIMLTAFAQNGQLHQAKLLFDAIPDKDAVAWNAMSTAYGQHGDIRNAEWAFANNPQKNRVSWNAMLAAYAQNGQSRDAITCFKFMELEGLVDNISLVIAFDACARAAALADGKLIHCNVANWEFDNVVANSLLNMYSKCEELEQAVALFVYMPARDSTTWNVILSAFSNSQDARFVFDKCPAWNLISWNTLVTALGEDGEVEEAEAVFKTMPQRNLVTGNAMINAFARNRHLQKAKNLFDGMERRDVVSWTSLLSGYVQNGKPRSGLKFFASMLHEGIKPNRITFMAMLEGCANAGDMNKLGLAYDSLLEKENASMLVDSAIASSLVNAYGKCGSIEKARAVFDSSAKKTEVSWNSIIAAYAQHKNKLVKDRAVEMLWRMCLDGMQPNEVTFITLLDACVSIEEGKRVHLLFAESDECCSSCKVGSALVSFYGKQDRLEEARAVFDSVLDANHDGGNVILHTAMVSAYAQNDRGGEALRTFLRMDLEGVSPNEVTFVSALDGCAAAAAAAEGAMIHSEVALSGMLDASNVVANSLLNMYAKCGRMGAAGHVFETMRERDEVSWNSMILGYAQLGHVEQAMGLLLAMKLEGETPTALTFISVLSACTHAGLIEDSVAHLASMVGDYGIVAGVDHYLCLVGLLARAGRLEEAEELIRSMPFEPDVVAWTSLLNACRVGGDWSRGGRAADRVAMIDPNRQAAYVLLSNMFTGVQNTG